MARPASSTASVITDMRVEFYDLAGALANRFS